MRINSALTALICSALIASACTVKDVEVPALSGPSTFATSILLNASTDTLLMDGVSQAVISITAVDSKGTPKNIPLRADITVGGVVQDYGRLNTKSPTANGSPLIYTAPPASALATPVSQTVTIIVTPVDAGDFRSESARQVDIRLVPQGIILPTNPDLIANFTFSPAAPKAFETVSFDATTTTNATTACTISCSYSWDFGDGTTGTGITATHEYRAVGNVVATLTATDFRGAQAKKSTTIPIAAPTPPTAAFDFTPTVVGVNQDVFFTATQSSAVNPRRIVSYEWTFGDGQTGGGVTTSHKYTAPGTYILILKVTDDVGAFASVQKSLTVSEGLPTVTMTVLPASPKPNQQVTVNITATPSGSSTISTYKISWGDGSPEETVSAPTQSHTYTGAGTFVISVTAIDSLGRQKTATASVTVAP